MRATDARIALTRALLTRAHRPIQKSRRQTHPRMFPGARRTMMEEDWLTDLLDVQGATAVMPNPNLHVVVPPMPSQEPSRHVKRNGGGKYITPPNMRKTAALPVGSPVLAVKVVKEEGGEEDAEDDADDAGEYTHVAWAPASTGEAPMPLESEEHPGPVPLEEVPTEPKPEMTWDASVSCVPPGAAWVTTVPPPRREKRARKVRAAPHPAALPPPGRRR